MTEFLPADAENKFQIYDLHKSLGVIVLILIFVRLINRITSKQPAVLESLPKIEKFASKFVHELLYFLMIFVPLSGYMMSNSYGFPVHLFSIAMPNLIEANPLLGRFFATMHEILAYTLLTVVILHFLGAMKHRFFDKPENDFLKRML